MGRLITPPKALHRILVALKGDGYLPFIVGGAVRDGLLGLDPKDFDVEVYGFGSIHQMAHYLKRFGKVDVVGKSFGVVKLKLADASVDFSLPRVESKVGKGHRGFRIRTPKSISLTQALRRRDFTIGAMAYDPLAHRLHDPFGGKSDLKLKRLRHIDNDTFTQDPLRIYRAIGFAARFELSVVSETKHLCKEMVTKEMLEELPKERIFEEIKKLLLKANRPSIGFELMRKWGIVRRYFSELHALIGCKQDRRYHPEGDVWTHTMMVIDQMADICQNECQNRSEKERLILMFATLTHDLGKPVTTTVEKRADGSVRIRAIGHEVVGVEVAERFLLRLTSDQAIIKGVLPLVRHHLAPMQLFRGGAKSGAIRRLSTKVKIDDLVLLAKADFLGRLSDEAKRGIFEAGEWLLKSAKRLGVERYAPKPLIKGGDLLALGLSPSPRVGWLLKKIYDAQLEGKISTSKEALLYAKQLIRKECDW